VFCFAVSVEDQFARPCSTSETAPTVDQEGECMERRVIFTDIPGVPRQHANTCKPNDVRSDEFRKRKLASAFIQNFAENNALVLPGRITNYKNPDLKLSVLPLQNCTQLESATRLSGSKARRLILVW